MTNKQLAEEILQKVGGKKILTLTAPQGFALILKIKILLTKLP